MGWWIWYIMRNKFSFNSIFDFEISHRCTKKKRKKKKNVWMCSDELILVTWLHITVFITSCLCLCRHLQAEASKWLIVTTQVCDHKAHGLIFVLWRSRPKRRVASTVLFGPSMQKHVASPHAGPATRACFYNYPHSVFTRVRWRGLLHELHVWSWVKIPGVLDDIMLLLLLAL